MAKRTSLELENAVLKNIGEPVVTGLTSLTGAQLVAWDKIQESIYEVAVLARFTPLRGSASISMLTGTNTYTCPSDLWSEQIKTFRVVDQTNILTFRTDDEWDTEYPAGIGTATTGWPTQIHRLEADDKYELNYYPAAAQNGKKIIYRYHKRPSLLSTASASGTCWFPEGFDDLVLVNLATYKTMVYLGSSEAIEYWKRVYGNVSQGGKKVEGTLDQMRRIYANNQIYAKPSVTYIF